MGCCASVDNSNSSRDAPTLSTTKIPGILDYTGQGMVGVPPIPNSMQVSTLLLQNNFLTTLPGTLALPTLTELDLSSNRFVRVPEVLRKQTSLTFLNISNNPLSRTGGYEELPHIESLKHLRLAMCSIRKVPPAMARCTNLISLDLSYNHFIDLSGPEIPSLDHLEELNISNCTLKDSLSSGVTSSASLTHLNISFNSFSLSGAHAFGTSLEANLSVLHCSGMSMAIVPVGIVNLRALKELHLAKNKGVNLKHFREAANKRQLAEKEKEKKSASGDNHGSSLNSEKAASTDSEGHASTASTQSIAGIETLNISDCELDGLPDGIDGIASSLTTLDVSYNENIDIMELSGMVPRLKKLSVLGCRFALKGDGRDHEWFELAKLRDLEDIEWNVWGESKRFTGFSSNPYSTKFPFQLCALKLQRMNCMSVRPGMFTGDRIQTLQAVLRDGYYKVDFLFEPMAIAAHHHIIDILSPKATTIFEACQASPLLETVLRQRYCFFLFLQALHPESVLLPPLEVVVVHYAHMCIDPTSYRRLGMRLFSHIVDNNYRLTLIDDLESGDLSRYSGFWDTEVAHLEESRKVSLDWLRYNVFSVGTATAVGKSEAPVVPNPGVLEERAAADVAGASNNSNNNGSSASTPSGSSTKPPPLGMGAGAALPAAPNPFLPKSQGGSLELLDALKVTNPGDILNVLGLLDPGSDRQVKLDIVSMLREFVRYARNVVAQRDNLESLGSEAWLRYAKYLSVCARGNNVTSLDESANGSPGGRKTSDQRSPLTPAPNGDGGNPAKSAYPVDSEPPSKTAADESAAAPTVANGESKQEDAAGDDNASVPPPTESSAENDDVNKEKDSPPKSVAATPSSATATGLICAPTFTIKDVLYLHRTTPIKYHSTMKFLGVDFSNVENRVNTPHKVSEMNDRWVELFNEPYVTRKAISGFDDNLASLRTDTTQTSDVFSGVATATPPMVVSALVSPSIANPGALGDKATKKKNRRVTMATLDVQ